jgi:pyruvate ferredoxin oxidoreductase gamma subunit
VYHFLFYRKVHLKYEKIERLGLIMKNGIEIRWHGRGGQGAKTAALLLADVAFKTGQYVQGFPEYGPERMGAPITAYNRISSDVIRVHSNIYHPDYVVVVDETLLDSVDVTAGLKEAGALIINTPKSREEIREHLGDYTGRVYTVDARKISVETLGKNFPNTPMLAATVAVSGVMPKEKFIHEMRTSYQHKFAKKPEVIDGNMQALERAYEVVEEAVRKDNRISA